MPGVPTCARVRAKSHKGEGGGGVIKDEEWGTRHGVTSSRNLEAIGKCSYELETSESL